MNKQTQEALKMAIEAFELEESTWWSHTKMSKAYNACKEALKPHPDCDEACMYQCEHERKHKALEQLAQEPKHDAWWYEN
jgi:hypothetical protein